MWGGGGEADEGYNYAQNLGNFTLAKSTAVFSSANHTAIFFVHLHALHPD